MQPYTLIQKIRIPLGALLLGLTAGLIPFSAAQAQNEYPNKPIRLIVPFPPGGGTDLIARTVAQKITETKGWNIVVDNRPGAGGNLGIDAAAKSTNDGYTLVIGQTSNLAINPSIYKKLPYDPVKDLAPIALVSSAPVLMVSGTKSKYRSIQDVIQAAKTNPDVVTVGYAGNGTVSHLAVTQLEMAAGIKLRHVPYKGVAQALTDISGGQIDLFVGAIPSLLGQVRTGKLEPIVVTSQQRSGQLSNTPTLAESGYPNFESITWFGILAPAGTPESIITKLNHSINQVLQQEDAIEKLRSEGGDVLGSSSEEFAALIQKELPHWAEVVKSSGAMIN